MRPKPHVVHFWVTLSSPLWPTRQALLGAGVHGMPSAGVPTLGRSWQEHSREVQEGRAISPILPAQSMALSCGHLSRSEPPLNPCAGL